MDTMTSDVSKPTDVMSLLQLTTSEDGQGDMANNLELFNAALASTEGEASALLESQSTIELNGERHVIVQETQDPETGELLMVLQSENGTHIALPSSAFQSGIVQMADANQLEIMPQQDLEQQQQPQDSQQEQQEQPMDTQVNVEGTINGAPEDPAAVNTAEMTTEMQAGVAEGQEKAPEVATASIEDNDVAAQNAVDGQDVASSAVFPTDAASLEALVANAMASGATGQDFVIMAEETPGDETVNAGESVEVGGGDGTVYAEQVVDDSSQYASNGSTEEMILNAMSQSGTLSDGQVIHAVVDNQTFAYTISATDSGFQLIPMGPVVESPKASPKKASPVARPSKPKQSPSGETLLVASARTEGMNSGNKKRSVARVGSKPNPVDNQRFMGKAVIFDNDSPSLLTSTAPGPSQLASSRRTYSKKNVVWCNPESKTSKATFPTVPKTVPRTVDPPITPAVAVSQPASQTTPQPTTVANPLKVAPIPTPSSPEKSKYVARAASPAKIPQIAVAKSNPVLIDDGKTIEVSKAVEAEIRPKSPAKKENGIPAPKPIVEVSEKRVIRNKRTPAKVQEIVVAEAEVKEPDLKPVSVQEKPTKPDIVDKGQEKERPTRARKPTPKVAEVTATKTPSKGEKPMVETAAPVEPIVEKATPSRTSRRAKKLEEDNLMKEDKSSEVADEKSKDKESKKEDKVPKEASKKEEKGPIKVDEKTEMDDKKDELPKASSSEDEGAGVRRSSRAPKRKSIDDDVIVEEKKVVLEKRTRVKEAEKREAIEEKVMETEDAIQEVEKKTVEEKKTRKEVKGKEVKGKSVVEETTTPRKRVGFAAEVSEGEEEAKDAKRRRSAPAEKKITPSKVMTPKKTDMKPILKRTPGSTTPKGRRLETPIVATFSPVDPKAENKVLKDVIESLNDQRSPDQRYDISSPGCDIHIRHQSASLTNYTPRGTGSSYACQKCGFRTSRMNNLVVHHKEQCPVVKNAQMMSWKAEIRKQTKTPPTVNRRTSELSASSPEEEEGSPVPASSFAPYDPPAANRASDIDAPVSADEEDEAYSLEKKIRDKFGFAPKDIVWVQWKNTSWPAVAVSVDIKKGEVQARLIDGPERSSRKGIKINVDKVAPFDDAEQNKRLLREGRERENGDLLVKAVQKAEEHLRKQCLGESNLVKVLGDLEADFSDVHSDDDRPDHSNLISAGSSRSPGTEAMDSMDDESVFANAQTMDQWKERRRVRNAQLLQCVKEGKVETHLLGVYTGSIQSERHQKFKSGSDADKNPLSLAWFGPIDDEDQQEEIYEYCSQLFKSNFKPDGNFDNVAYLFEVWVPEAIMKAISRVRRLEMKEAEEVFQRGVVLSKSEKEEIRRENEKQVSFDGPSTSTM